MPQLTRITLVFIALLIAAPVSAADFEKGLAAYDRSDYATALREWKPLAKQGHAKAQSSLGTMFAEGRGVPRDDKEAVKWYRKAAVQGNAVAQNNLGVMYREAQDVIQDYKEAVMWIHKAAVQGNVTAQSSLGFMLAYPVYTHTH